MRLLLLPLLVAAAIALLAALLIVSVLHLLFNAVHLHWLARNTTSPALDQFIKLGEWVRKKQEQRA